MPHESKCINSGVVEVEEGRRGEATVESKEQVRTARHQEREEEVVHQMYTQCTRLNSCIQAAASRLQDSTKNKHRATKRVELLIQLIPQRPSFPLGEYPLQAEYTV